MKKMFVFMVLGLVAFSASNARAAGCYITPTNDYICDDTSGAGGAHGGTVQRDTLNDVSGSSYVFQAGNVRSQYSWMPGVLMNLGLNINSPPPGTTSVGTIPSSGASGAGTAEWSGVECKAGTDPRVAAQQEVMGSENIVLCSYYDGFGGQKNCSWSWRAGGGGGCPCSSKRGGCLTIGVGHLVLQSEMSKYAPCSQGCKNQPPVGPACFTHAEIMDLFQNQDFPRYWNPAVKTAHDMCLSDAEAACFLVALTSINYQLGPNWVLGRKGYTGHAGDAMMAGQFKDAANRFASSKYCNDAGGAYKTRCMKLVAALNDLADKGAKGCDGIAGN